MRIALVCSEVIRESGHGRYMLELARRLARDHEVHVYADLFQGLPGVTWHRVRSPEGFNLARVFVFWWRASRAIAHVPYDIVHTIGGCCSRRDVVTAQFCQRAWGAQLASAPAAARVGSPLRRLYHQIYWRACDWLEAPAFRDRPGKRLIAVSRGVRSELEAFYGASPSRIHVIHNGVEPADFAPEALAPHREAVRARWGLGASATALLFVGDFTRKGLATTIEALARMRLPDAHLLVVGRGDVPAFRARAEALGVGDRVHFVGFQPDVVPYFAASDAFVFPTRYEPFGMVVTEAMAAGLPTVTTAAAGAAEVIVPGVSGEILADPDDAVGLAARLDALLADPSRRDQMGLAARSAARRVDWDAMVRETLAVYAQVLAERASAVGVP